MRQIMPIKHLTCSKKRRYLGGSAIAKLGFCTSWAIKADALEPDWIETVEVDFHLPNNHQEFRGKRIVHISDMHCSRTVTEKYLRHCVDRVNSLDADIVLLTGDYVTHDFKGKYRHKAVELIGDIKSKLGTFACLGNHDYGIGSLIRSRRSDLLAHLTSGMKEKGVKLLRNDSHMIEIEGKPLWFVGLGDIWAEDFHPGKAFSKVPKGQPVITLLHNPEGVKLLKHFPAGAVMSGHTHGVQHPFATSLKIIGNRRFHAGMYHIGDKKLYVNRGLGRLGQMICNPRPEITLLTIQ